MRSNTFLNVLEQYANKVWYGPLRLWLVPFSWVFYSIVSIRRFLYRFGWFATYRAPFPLVVVGSLVVGGAAKTPVVIALAKMFSETGLRVAIISRGYKRSTKNMLEVTALHTPFECGDEPYLIFHNTGCITVVSNSRAEALQYLTTKQPSIDLVLSDDGLTHYTMERDKEILLFNDTNPLGNGWLLPAGPLREPPHHRPSAALWYKGVDFKIAIDPVLYQVQNPSYTLPIAPILGLKVVAMCGIARPERFFHTLRGFGLVPIEAPFPDHYAFSAQDFKNIGSDPIIMTEKDAIKCRHFAPPHAWFLRMRAVIEPEVYRQLCVSLGVKHG